MVDGYTAVYGGEDLAEAGIDVGGNFLAEMANQSGTLAVIVIAGIVLAVIIGFIVKIFVLPKMFSKMK